MDQTHETIERLQAWREGIARLYLTGLVYGLPVVAGLWWLSRRYFGGPLAVLLFVWLIAVVLRVFATGRFQAMALVFVTLVAGMAGSLTFGLSSGPALSMGSGIILAAAVFGRRVGLTLLVLVSVGTVVVGALATGGALPHLDTDSTDPSNFSNWLRLAAFFFLSVGLLLQSVSGLFERMEEAWRATAAAAVRERAEQEHRLRAEAERHAAEERARDAQRLEAIGRLAGGVAHDFNNLLVIIMSWADLLPRAKSDEERQEGTEAIRDAAAQAAQLTRQLLAFARKDVSNPSPVDVDAFVAGTMKSLKRMLPDDVSLEHRPGAPARALVDEGQLGQVLLNLVANARDAMPRGGAITVSSEVLSGEALPPEAPDRARRYVALTVTDSGHGMDETTRARVFEPFFTTKGRARGTGLGLASVQGIVTQAGGWVSVASAPGAGARFTVAFPEASVAAAEARAARSPGPRHPDGRARRVLLVEDDAEVRRAMALALRSAGFEPLEAGHADEALTLARGAREPFDLLCTDAVMPGTPTHVLVDGFRQLFPGAPVLLCTGYVEEELLRRGIAEGTVAVMQKPFTPDALVRRANELLTP